MAIFRKLLPLLALALAAGCGQGPRAVPGPLDRFTFPTGLALAPLPGGGRALVVVSSNFDLRYSTDEGGSVLAVDPDASQGDDLRVLGAARIPSFGGEAAVLSDLPSPADGVASCSTWAGGTQVLVPSRTANALYRLDLDAQGALACGDACRIPLHAELADPYAVQIVCRTGPASAVVEQSAYVTHLRAPGSRGWLSKLDLSKEVATTGAALNPSLIDLGQAPPTGTFAWDPARERLYVTGRFAVFDLAPLHWLDLAVTGSVSTVNLGQTVRGSELRAMALSSPLARPDEPRSYVALRLFDRDLAGAFGARTGDVAGALAVVDRREAVTGGPRNTILRLVPIGRGPSQVVVLPRGDGRRDVVAVSSTDEGTVTLYDDESEAVVAVLGVPARDLPADATADELRPFGKQPFGLVSEATGPTTRRLYVGSFDRGFVRVVDVDLDRPALAVVGKKFGREVP